MTKIDEAEVADVVQRRAVALVERLVGAEREDEGVDQDHADDERGEARGIDEAGEPVPGDCVHRHINTESRSLLNGRGSAFRIARSVGERAERAFYVDGRRAGPFRISRSEQKR